MSTALTSRIEIDGDGIEWNGLFESVMLKACANNDAGADLINIFGAEIRKHEPIAFAVEFPWSGDRQETRSAVGVVEHFDKGEEFVTVYMKCSENPKVQVTRKTIR